ncbi:MAG TPA: hypothetical protein VG326_21800 [Tepidisphaeraceae bacterium]|jgi:hypothetical protein|nr:hypothetical protein [Tepidisphaeraceae bacterium]
MWRSSKEFAAVIASEIGPDAAYVRNEEDRLYLTGIEIGIAIGTGILTSFCIGLLRGVKKATERQAEGLGEALVDRLIDKLKRILGKTDQAISATSEESTTQLAQSQDELDEIINDPEVSHQITSSNQKLVREEIIEVSAYLCHIGFPQTDTEERAEILVKRIHREWLE